MIDDIFNIVIGLSIVLSILIASNKTRIGKYINRKNGRIHKNNKELYPDCPLISDDGDKE